MSGDLLQGQYSGNIIYLRTKKSQKGCRQRGWGGDGAHTNIKEMRDELEQLLDDNPLLTLNRMKDELKHSLPDKPLLLCLPVPLDRTLDGMLMALKAFRGRARCPQLAEGTRYASRVRAVVHAV